MRDTELFQMALALSPPWTVTECRFDAQARQLDIRLDFPRGSTFPCPTCAAPGCRAYDTEEMTWRHLNFFQHEAYLHAFVPRVTCTACGVKKVAVPWARAGSGFTLLFEALIMTMLGSMPVAAVAPHRRRTRHKAVAHPPPPYRRSPRQSRFLQGHPCCLR
jgi:transposase